MANALANKSYQRISRSSRGLSQTMLVLFVIAIFTSRTVASSSGAEKGPSSVPRADLICHTDNPDDCYPRIFQPTDEFQTVHNDQDLPSGLHVRMNVWTGEKEAKINVPEEQDFSLEGLPIDRSVVVVDPEAAANEQQVPRGAPTYDPVGKIKEPQDELKTESGIFQNSLAVLKTLALDDRPFDLALEVLEDIAHDIYYGLKITEDTSALKTLLCMMSNQNIVNQYGNEHALVEATRAASILGAALQNNPAALREVEKAWHRIKETTCDGQTLPLNNVVFGMLFPDGGTGTSNDSNNRHSSLVKAKAGALNGLIKSPVIRDDFLANDGMAHVLRVLISEAPELIAAQRKLANLVLDNFLDEDMGAILGVWPRSLPVDRDWDHHIKRIAELNRRDRDHWSVELRGKLKEQRATSNHGAPVDPASRVKEEL